MIVLIKNSTISSTGYGVSYSTTKIFLSTFGKIHIAGFTAFCQLLFTQHQSWSKVPYLFVGYLELSTVVYNCYINSWVSYQLEKVPKSFSNSKKVWLQLVNHWKSFQLHLHCGKLELSTAVYKAKFKVLTKSTFGNVSNVSYTDIVVN